MIEGLERPNIYASCNNEQTFKMKWLKEHEDIQIYCDFCIETEETVRGFPDVMRLDKRCNQAIFFEFKYTKTGKIKFQPTQPSFYKEHDYMDIRVVAYNAKTRTVHVFFAKELFSKTSLYKLNDDGTVNLNHIEAVQLIR